MVLPVIVIVAIFGVVALALAVPRGNRGSAQGGGHTNSIYGDTSSGHGDSGGSDGGGGGGGDGGGC